MRIFGFMLLGLSAAFVGCNPPAAEETTPMTSEPAMEMGSGSTGASMGTVDKSVQLVSMKVSMHCPYGCYPKVKETLESEAGVSEVTLAAQKSADTIDNPVVYIATTGNFDAAKAMKALEAEGFESEVLAN